MAATVTTPNGVPRVLGTERMVRVDIEFDDSYPTGGEIITPAMCGLSRFDFGWATGCSEAYEAQFDPASGGVVLRDSADGGQVTAATDTTGVAVQLVIIGN